MKKIVTLFVFIISKAQLQSQTINPNWFFELGHKTRTVSVSNSQNFQKPEEGVDKVWDFSKAIPIGTNENIVYVEPQTVTSTDSFPFASIVAESINDDSKFRFYQEEEDHLLLLGSVRNTNTGTPFLIKYTDPIHELECPLPFGSNFEDSYSYRTYLGSEFVNEHFGLRQTSFVGIGKVITPTGVFDNCFMLKVEDENDVSEPFISYLFFKDNLSNLIASYTEQGMTAEGMIQKRITYQISEINITSTDNLFELAADLVVLNGELLKLTTPENFKGQLDIYSLDGKLLLSERLQIVQGVNLVPIQINTKCFCVIVLTDINSNRFKSVKMNLN